jgi:hypothetical protein
MARSKKARMAATVKRNASSPPAPGAQSATGRWWQKSEKFVVRAGAVAGAVTAIIALAVYFWPKPDPGGKAAILNVPLTPQPLSSYSASATIAALPERGASPDLITPPGVLWEAWSIDAPILGVDSPVPESLPEPYPEPPPEPYSDSSTSGDPGSPATEPASPATEPASPATEPGSPATADASTDPLRLVPSEQLPDPTPPPVFEAAPEVREQVYCAAIQQAVVQSRYSFGGECDKPRDLPPGALVSYLFEDQAVDMDGNAVPPEVAAERLVAVLERVRSVPYSPPPDAPGETPREGLLDPLGLRATVNVEFEGLNGRTLLLYWRLSPTTPEAASLPAPWFDKTLAWQFTPKTERGSGLLDVWVPLPEAQGPYVLDFFIAVEDSFLTSYRTDSFD